MKLRIFPCSSAVLLAAALCLHAGEPPAAKGSPEFERMKSMVGTWEGKVDMGEGLVDMTVQYRLLAAGSVLEERCFIGTPNEMVSMFYDQGGKLAMTHYCVMGNRPSMILNSSDAKTIRFDFDKACGIDPAKESHMHALTIQFDDANTVTTSCSAFIDGKEVDPKPTVLKRVKQGA